VRGAFEVFRRKTILRTLLPALFTVLAVTTTPADDVEKKWRIGFAAGFFNSQDEIESSSANVMATIIPCAETQTCEPGVETVVRRFRDPRSDSQVFGNLDINPAMLGTLSVQYGLSKIFVIEGSVGYQKGDVGDVEVAVELLGNESDFLQYNFLTRRVTVGELESVPIRVTALARLRPRATLNPYFGVGMGYAIVGLSLDSEFNQLSRNMDVSRGAQRVLNPFFNSAPAGVSNGALQEPAGPLLDLRGATVDARDTFEWHLAGGAEIAFKKRWAAFVDIRWVDASRSVSIGFNGSDELGNSLPNFNPFDDSPLANAAYGPATVGNCRKDPSGNLDQNGEPLSCTGGGLLDLGRFELVAAPGAPSNTNCKTNPSDIQSIFCVVNFVFEPDSVPDQGDYYVQGGTFDYDGFQAQVGVRFTFGQ
jgi:hypothetical protein